MYQYKIHTSVTAMVEFILRGGSIDYEYKSSSRAKRGTQVHQILQQKHSKTALLAGFYYDEEYTLVADIDYKNISYEIEGRADGIILGSDTVYIEEIKSTTKEPMDITKAKEVHMAQAICYGYLFCLLKGLEKAVIYLTYCNTESLETKIFEKPMTLAELKGYFYSIIERLYKWNEMELKNAEIRNESINQLAFPYGNFRKGQRDFSSAVYKTIHSSKKLFAIAPTGTGKTVASIFPTLKYLPQLKGSIGKIFYLTAKNITRGIGEDCIRLMLKKGLKVKAIVLSSKEKSCPCENNSSCTAELCHLANGHFDRVNTALWDILNENEIINLDTLLAYGEKYQVCPFELGLDASLFADVIICDYNYAYDPKAKLKRFFEEVKGDYIALVDEAHNLVDRAREMFSAELSKNDINEVLSLLPYSNSHIYRTLYKINSFFVNELARLDYNQEALVKKNYPEELLNLLNAFIYDADFYLRENSKNETYDKLLQLYFNIQDFLRISELYNNSFCTMLKREEGNAVISLMCLDPASLLSVAHKSFKASVFFSATLSPLDYFIDVLGGDKNDNYMAIPSPFDNKNLLVLLDTSIQTTYQKRASSYEKIADRLFAMVNSKVGNYFAFFSSYSYMKEVLGIFRLKYPDIASYEQKKGMTEAEKESFISLFSSTTNKAQIGFVVLGGAFSEGIDLDGEKLIGTAVIGVGLPMVCLEKNIIQNYYKEKNNMGFEYAYQYPGMNKVLQAAGRVIRTEKDRGIVLLIDSRYSRQEYKKLFPRQWENAKTLNGKTEEILKAFWENK